MYEKIIKRALDLTLSFVAFLILLPLLLILTLLGAVVMKGNPFFVQPRPGKGERIFYLIKYKTMVDRWDADGKLLPDEARLVPYGRFLRATSLDELPSLLNIIKGDLAIVGPRPQLVRDMVFMTERQRKRHSVRPGLTGLAQCNGRNNMLWETKFEYDLQYIDGGITLWKDLKIILKTALKVIQQDGITAEGMVSTEDFGDYLLHKGAVDQESYDEKQAEAVALLARK